MATQGLSEEFGNERIIDAPLAEASIMGIALGAAFRGMRPIPEVQFSDFVWPSVNQLIGEAARTCYGTNGAVQVPMVIRMPYGGGIRGGLFHSQNVETHFFHTPGLKVVAPSTPYDAKGLLKSAIRDNRKIPSPVCSAGMVVNFPLVSCRKASMPSGSPFSCAR